MVDATLVELAMMFLTAITVLSATYAAYLSYRSIKTNINTTKSQVLLQCLREYIDIQKDRTNAKIEKTEELCSDYYRELFDVHWTEFQLWRLNFIDDDSMTAWLNSRYRNYLNDYLIAKNEKGKEIKICYKDSWEKSVQENYFEKDDPFLAFMKLAHDNNIKEALKMKLKRLDK